MGSATLMAVFAVVLIIRRRRPGNGQFGLVQKADADDTDEEGEEEGEESEEEDESRPRTLHVQRKTEP